MARAARRRQRDLPPPLPQAALVAALPQLSLALPMDQFSHNLISPRANILSPRALIQVIYSSFKNKMLSFEKLQTAYGIL